MSQTNTWVKGVLILTAAGLMSRFLGMVYRIPLQNIAGDEGLYVYQQIYPILSLAIILSLYGIPSAITQQVTEHELSSQYLTKIFYLLAGLGVSVWAVLFAFAEVWANLMGDPLLEAPIKVSSFMFLLLPFVSVLRAFFQRMEQARFVGISQVVEQLIRVILIIVVTVFVVSMDLSIYDLGTYAAVATILGTVSAIIYLGIHFQKKSPLKIEPISERESLTHTAKWLFIGIFVYSLTYVLHLVLQLLDVFTMVPLLQDYGLSFNEARELKGVFDRGNPMIQLGLVFGSSLGFALVPGMQSHQRATDAKLAIKLTFVFSLAASVGLIAIMQFLNPLFYLDQQGTVAIQWLMLLVFLLSMVITLSVLLQGLQYKQQQLKWILLLMGTKFLLNQLLIPLYGIVGAAIASILSALLLVMIFYWIWARESGLRIEWLFYVKAVLAVLVMFGVVTGLAQLFSGEMSRLGLILPTLVLSTVGAIVLVVLVWVMNILPRDFIHQLRSRKK